MTLVGVFPLNVHTLSGGFVHLNRPWIGSGNGQNARFFGLNAPHLPSWSGLYGLVGHTRSMTSRPQSCSRGRRSRSFVLNSALECPRAALEDLKTMIGAVKGYGLKPWNAHGVPVNCASSPQNRCRCALDAACDRR